MTRRRWAWMVVALAISISAKYIFILLGPPILIYAIHQDGKRAVKPLIIGSIAGLAVMAALFFPFYEGPGTFTSIFGGLQRWISSPTSLLNTSLTYALNNEVLAGSITKRSTLAIFAVIYLILLWRQKGSLEQLIITSFYVMFFYHTVIGWWYWPWYLLWLLPFAALLVGTHAGTIAFILSYTSLLAYIPVGWERFLWDPAGKFIGVEVGRTFFIWSAPLIYWATIPLHRLRTLYAPKVLARDEV